VDEETRAEFGLKPSAFWGHDLVGVGDGDELIDRGGEEAKGDGGEA